ncbi:MAG: aminotransferase class IV [Pseudomonadota bacterium]
MATLINIDGTIYEDVKDAKISVFDRGFLYGDSVYEVIRSYGEVPFAMKEHLYRMRRSADTLHMELAVPTIKLESEIRKLLAKSGNQDSYIRIIATRGEGEISLDPRPGHGTALCDKK